MSISICIHSFGLDLSSIQVAQDEDLAFQIGKEIHFDLVDHDKVRSFRVQKQTLFSHFKEEVAKDLGIPVGCQRYWLWAKRQNHTYRPNRPLTEHEEAQTVRKLFYLKLGLLHKQVVSVVCVEN
jgi:ubiquitin carboxyl-terminal hydrolase 7